MAEMFTFPTSSYAIYWTDVTYDNFAVDKNGKVRIIDAENLLVVDKWRLRMGEDFVFNSLTCEWYYTLLSF